MLDRRVEPADGENEGTKLQDTIRGESITAYSTKDSQGQRSCLDCPDKQSGQQAYRTSETMRLTRKGGKVVGKR